MVENDRNLVRDWMSILASGPAEAWDGKVAPDVRIRLPFAPPGVTAEVRGIRAAIEAMTAHWGATQSFDWRDIVIRRTEENGLFVSTARSEVLLRSGRRYANDYIMFTRIADGLIVEHTEFFNPLPVIEMLAPG